MPGPSGRFDTGRADAPLLGYAERLCLSISRNLDILSSLVSTWMSSEKPLSPHSAVTRPLRATVTVRPAVHAWQIYDEGRARQYVSSLLDLAGATHKRGLELVGIDALSPAQGLDVGCKRPD